MTQRRDIPPRVLMVVPQYPYPIVGGLEKQSHVLSKELTEQGVSVQVLSGKIIPSQPDRERVEGVAVFRMPWPSTKAIRFARSPFDVAAAMLRLRANYDVVHLHQHSWVGLYVILLARLLGKPVLTKMPNVGDYGIPGIRRQFLGGLRIRILRLSDAIVAMSLESRRELEDVGYPVGRVLSVTNGIAVSTVPVIRSGRSTPVRVVCVGRLDAQKGLDVLLQAWKEARGRLQVPAILELWGKGPLEGSLKDLAAKLGVQEEVVFAGHVDGAPTKLSGADIFVLASRAEGNSNSVLEAMAAGLPIVSTPVGGTPMLVGDVGAPFLCPVGDVGRLSDALARLIEDPDYRVELGTAMRNRISEHFDIRKVALTYRAAYSLLVRGEARSMASLSSALIPIGTVTAIESQP